MGAAEPMDFEQKVEQMHEQEVCFKTLHKIQLPTFAFTWLLNEPYENEVTLTGQNQPLRCYKLLELLTQLKKGIDLSMLKISGL